MWGKYTIPPGKSYRQNIESRQTLTQLIEKAF